VHGHVDRARAGSGEEASAARDAVQVRGHRGAHRRGDVRRNLFRRSGWDAPGDLHTERSRRSRVEGDDARSCVWFLLRQAMYHEGELTVQRKAGVAADAARVGRIIGNTIPPVAAEFVEAQSIVIASTIDREGLVW